MRVYVGALDDATEAMDELATADFAIAGRRTATWMIRLGGGTAFGLTLGYYVAVPGISPPRAVSATLWRPIGVGAAWRPMGLGTVELARGIVYGSAVSALPVTVPGRVISGFRGREMTARIRALEEALSSAEAAMEASLTSARAYEAMIAADPDPCCRFWL